MSYSIIIVHCSPSWCISSIDNRFFLQKKSCQFFEFLTKINNSFEIQLFSQVGWCISASNQKDGGRTSLEYQWLARNRIRGYKRCRDKEGKSLNNNWTRRDPYTKKFKSHFQRFTHMMFEFLGTLGRYRGASKTGEDAWYRVRRWSNQLETFDGSKWRNTTSLRKNENNSKQIWWSIIGSN